ncbi:MAG TPA: hypothetical protein VGR57_06360 [Ktedonobacterales bacterium]|nr:hypothetical protein [Ktedonobacterales bacterium]
MARTPRQSPDASTPRIGVVRDVFNGAVRGDYAPRLGVPGAATQIALAFVPGVGTLCAMRDALADWGRRDGVGVTLNLLALVPLFGGFPKTAAVLRTVQHVGRAVHVTRQRGQRGQP